MSIGRITHPSQLLQTRKFHINAAQRDVAQMIVAKKGDAVAWVWTDSQGRPCAVVFLGKAQRPWSGRGNQTGSAYTFKTRESRAAFVSGAFATAESIATAKAARTSQAAAARAAGHPLKVGDVLKSSWGYEQTNIDWYEVTKLVGTGSVEVREIACQSEETSSMQGVCTPLPGHYVGEPMRRKVSTYGQRDSVKVSRCANAHRVEPKVIGGIKVYAPVSWTAYA